MKTGSPFTGFRRAMRHRDYRNYTIGSITSLIGSWVHRVALGWLTWELTHSYAWLGIIAFSDMFAMMAFAPFAGALADRVDRPKISLWSQVAMMVQAMTLAFIVLTGLADIWLVFVLALMLGVMHAYHTAARLSLVPNLVPHEDLTPAIAINSMIFNVARFVGPALAGLVIVSLGIGPAFLLNTISFLVFIVILRRIRLLRVENPRGESGSMVENIAEGIRYAVRHPGIGPVLLLLAVTAFTGRALPDLLPGFADGVFGRGPEGLAWLASAMGLGASLSGLYFLSRDGVRGTTAIVLFNVLLMSLSSLVFVALDVFWAAVAVLVVVGFAMNNTTIGTLNLMQNTVEGRLRGRLISTYTVIQQGAPAAGTLTIGAVAEFTGLAWPVAAAASCGILLWLAMTPKSGRMRDALETEPPNHVAESRT